MHEDKAAEDVEAAVAAERERCAKFLMDLHDEYQETMSLGARPMASMVTGALRDAVEEVSPGYVAKRYAAKTNS